MPAESTTLAALAATTEAVGATAKRNEKVERFIEVLEAAPPGEHGLVVSLLVGEPRQGKVGVGWSALSSLRGTGGGDGAVTAAELDRFIDEIAATTGSGSQGARSELLGSLGARLSPSEADFVRRVLLGDMAQGALAGVMTSAVAKAAGVPVASVRRGAMLLGNLADAADTAFGEGREGLDSIRLEVGRAVLPMLASTASDVADGLATLDGPASVEWKLDGARIQVHRSGDSVRIFTRNLNEVTDRLPEVVAIVRSYPADRFVLDGEVLVEIEQPDAASDAPVAFQDTMSRFGSEADSGGPALRPHFFDVLVADDVDLLDRPLAERAPILEAIVGSDRIPAIQTTSVDAAAAHLEHALAAGHEGVMVKGVDTTYEAGRRGKGWLKVKPVHTYDLVVLAVEWGHGRRTGWLSNLHLGARDPESGAFIMVGKTFKGLTDQLLAWQTERFLELETHRDGHVVHVRPEQVVEIALDGVQSSTRYPGGVALRFARVRGYRHDRDAGTADTIDSVRSLLR